jgi:prepilin peptidase CpaA
MSEVLTVIFLAALLACAVSDLRTRRIPNAISATAFLVAITLRGFAGMEAFTGGIFGAALAFAIVVPLFAMRGVGGGDAKMLIMSGAFLGPRAFLVALLATAVVGGAMSLVAAARGGVLLPALFNTKGLLAWVATAGRRGERTTLASAGAVSVPYGVAIAIGSAVALYLGGGI